MPPACTPSGRRSNDKTPCVKAGAHRDLYAPNRIFSRNTAQKNHGRRQPCHGFFSCLAVKSLALECFAVLRERFFLTGKTPDAEILDVFPRTLDFLWGKRFRQNRINPYAYPPNNRWVFIVVISNCLTYHFPFLTIKLSYRQKGCTNHESRFCTGSF